MAADDTVRYRLQRKLEDLVGPDEAALLMSNVPPFPWTDIATKAAVKADLEHTRELLEARLGARFTAEIAKQTRAYVLWNAAMLLTVAGMAFGAARLGV